MVGRLIGVALQDGRLLDLPLALPVCKYLLGKCMTLYDVLSMDRQLGKSLLSLEAQCTRGEFLRLKGENSRTKEETRELECLAETIEDSYLNMTLPAAPDYELKPGGTEIAVSIENLREYLSLLTQHLLVDSVRTQLDAIASGLGEVVNARGLMMLTPLDLMELVGGGEEVWSDSEIRASLALGHGYSEGDETVSNFVKVLAQFGNRDRRLFLEWATGSPRLPPGGLRALRPQLTLVKKHVDGNSGGNSTNGGSGASVGSSNVDQYFPSVSVCFGRIKMPAYSGMAILKERLSRAMRGSRDFTFD